MAHGFVACPLYSDPGPVSRAPFVDVPGSDRRAFRPMDDGSFASAGCPPVGPAGSAFGPADWQPAACLPDSPAMTCFFGEGSYDPAIVVTRPLAARLQGATQ